MDKRDGVEKALTYSDGNIYYLPMLDETPSGNIPYIVRTDWLDQLGLERPVTIEDWENYWSLVKTTDLNLSLIHICSRERKPVYPSRSIAPSIFSSRPSPLPGGTTLPSLYRASLMCT